MEVFASLEGDDRNDGSFSHPVRSLRRANGMMRPGDHLYLRSGDEWKDRHTLKIPQDSRLDAYGDGDPPHLTGMDVAVELHGEGAKAANLIITDTAASAVVFRGDDCLLETSQIYRCGRNGTAKDRAVVGFNVRRPNIKSTRVHDTLGGDNIYFYNAPGASITDCDLARPGEKAGDNLHLTGASDFYVGRTKFADVLSGKGHFIAHPWEFGSLGGVCENCEFYGSANFGVCLIQSESIYRYNKFFGDIARSAKWASAFWCANEENREPIAGIKVYDNLVADYTNGFGSWLPNASIPVQLEFDRNTLVRCQNWFSYEGKARLDGHFNDGIVIASGGDTEQIGNIELADVFFSQ